MTDVQHTKVLNTADTSAPDPNANGGVVVDKPIDPVKIPMPETVESLAQILRRFRDLDASKTYETERLGILQTLKKIDKEQQNYENDLDELDQLWNENNEEVDLNLLQKQIIGLQLLSKDLDLPFDLQLDYAENANPDLIKSNGNSDSSKVIELPLSDYEAKAHCFGVVPTRAFPDPEIHPVATNYAEEQLKTKIETRTNELEGLPSNIGSFDLSKIKNDLESANDDIIDGIDDLKLKALVELKSLRLLPTQKQLRNQLIIKANNTAIYSDENLYKYSTFRTWKRAYHIREKQKVEQTEILAEKLQEQQKKEKEQLMFKQQQSRVKHLMEIFQDAQNEVNNKKDLRQALGKSIHHFHQQIERDEGKRAERTAKQRLQALKSNDEEAYLALLDQTKDTRITHLLKQTNSFLDSLASAVKVQQHETTVMTSIDNGEAPEQVETPEVDPEEREKIDYYEVAHKVKEIVKKQPSILVGGKLKEYQVKGLEWMVSLYNNHLNGILADEMGLGKTIQSISLVTYLIEAKKEKGKFLIIVPLSTITNWTLEFEKWAPSVKTIVYKGSQQQRKSLQYEIRTGNFTVLLTTYEYIIRDRPLLSKFKWAHMIIDEGHRMKNSQSKLSQTLQQYYHTRNRLILTGTPLQNNLPELWALLNFILPKVFNSVKSFDEWFNTPFANTGHQDKLELTEEESLLVIRRLHKVLRPFLLRRLKRDVEKDLPDKVEKVIKCKKSGLQSVMYKQLLTHNALFVGADGVGAPKTGLRGLNNKIMQLRKVCNHPFVFEEVEAKVNPEKATNDLIWRSSGKFELLDRVLSKFKVSGHRVLIFFQMTQVMDIMEDYLRLKDMKYMRLDGSTKAEDRQLMLKDFNAPNSDYFCFLLSTRAGGLGLNLQTADTVIIFDTDWNPHQDLQAQDRAHRIGQKNEVRILRLITDDSVEEIILERAHQKLDIDGKVIQAGKFDNKSSAEEQEAFLKRLIEAEKQKDDEKDTDDLDDEELNDILARSDKEKILFNKIDKERNALDKKASFKNRLMSFDELPDVFKQNIEDVIPQEKETVGKRERKVVVYNDNLTDAQWLDALAENEDSTDSGVLQAALAKKARLERNRKSKRSSSAALSESETEASMTQGSEDEYNGDIHHRRKRTKGSSTSLKNETTFELTNDESFIKPSLELLDELTKLKSEDGRKLSDMFIEVPSRKLYPDYYQVIKKPMAIKNLKRNLNKNVYENLEEFKNDLQIMFDNAKTYNEEGSWVYEDAKLLEKFAQEEFDKISIESN